MAEKKKKKTIKAKKVARKPGVSAGKKKKPAKKSPVKKATVKKAAFAKKTAKAESSSGQTVTDIDLDDKSGSVAPDAGESEQPKLLDEAPSIDLKALFADDDYDEDTEGLDSEDFILFRLNDEGFALRVTDISEILRHQRITWVPRCAEYVIGMTSMRGAMMPVIDLHVLLYGKKSEPVEMGRILVLRDSDIIVGVLVNRKIGMKGFSADSILPPPAHLRGKGAAFVEGVLLVDEEFYTMLRPEAITRTRASGRLDEREA